MPEKHKPEFRVTIRVHNNRLLSRRKRLGVSQAVMAEAIGISTGAYQSLENCSEQPTKDGEWTKHAIAIAEYWDENIEELFPDAILALKTNKIDREVDFETLLLMSNGTYKSTVEIESAELLNRVTHAIKLLKPREREVVEKYYGIGNQKREFSSLKEVGESLEEPVSTERTRQILSGALRSLRRPDQLEILKGEAEIDEEAREKARKKAAATRRRKARAKQREELEKKRKQRQKRVEWETYLQEASIALYRLKRSRKKEFDFDELLEILNVSHSRLQRLLLMPEYWRNRRVGLGYKEPKDPIPSRFNKEKATPTHAWYRSLFFDRKEVVSWLEARIDRKAIISVQEPNDGLAEEIGYRDADRQLRKRAESICPIAPHRLLDEVNTLTRGVWYKVTTGNADEFFLRYSGALWPFVNGNTVSVVDEDGTFYSDVHINALADVLNQNGGLLGMEPWEGPQPKPEP